jgi:preprotein translocase subunit SecD
MPRSVLIVLAAAALFAFSKGDQALAQASGAQLGRQQPIIELRFAHDAPAPGLTYMESVSGKRRVYVEEGNIVSDDGIRRVHAKPTADGLVLDVQFSQEAGARLVDATSRADGRQIAVLINSRLVAAVPVANAFPIGTRRITIGLELPTSAAAATAARIAARWPE